MARVLAVSVASLDYMPEAGERAERLLHDLAEALGGLVALPERSGKRVVTSLNDAERVSIEAKHYSALLALVVTDKTARLVHALATRSEKPLILVVDPEGWSIPDALDAYNVLRHSGLGVSKPLVYPRDLDTLREYVETSAKLGDYRGTALMLVGSTPTWTLYGHLDETRFRVKLDATILRVDVNDVVLHFEETSVEEARRIFEESLREANVEADIDLLVNELRLYAAISRMVHENRVSAIAANCSELINKFGGVYIAASLLLERDSVPLACENDAAAAVTATLLGVHGRVLLARPRMFQGDRVEYEMLMTPPSMLKDPSIVFDERLGSLILRGHPETENEVIVARLDPGFMRLYARTCSVVDSREAPRPTLVLEGCAGVLEYPGSRHVLLPGAEADKVEIAARLLGLELVM